MKLLLESLFLHQAWADATLLAAVGAHAEAVGDEGLRKLLHHMVTVQRFYLARIAARPFDRAREAEVQLSSGELMELFKQTHAEALALVHGITESGLERRFGPVLQTEFTVAEGLTQIVMHSQNHRGQCLMRLREMVGKAPTLDYILWARERPAADWGR
ncbi:MAG TPA: DinB family protein [Terracidiphilus sp.]|jgi:uncharacterized damage-inducible protein DinB